MYDMNMQLEFQRARLIPVRTVPAPQHRRRSWLATRFARVFSFGKHRGAKA